MGREKGSGRAPSNDESDGDRVARWQAEIRQALAAPEVTPPPFAIRKVVIRTGDERDAGAARGTPLRVK